jgi:hypothetical protein
MDLATQSKPKPSRLRRLFRLPSFGVALAISITALIAFAAWMFVDACFPLTLEIVRVDLRLEDAPWLPAAGSAFHAWDAFGPRLLLLAVIAVAGLIATLMVFYRTLFGSAHSRTLRGMFVAVALVALWLTLGLSHGAIEESGFRWRLRRALPRLKQDAAVLLAQWPTTAGVLPFSGQFLTEANNPILVLLSDDVFAISETVGPLIQRMNDGGIKFDYAYGNVEYHPGENQPTSYTDPAAYAGLEALHAEYALQSYTELEPNWFFTTYEVTVREAADAAGIQTDLEVALSIRRSSEIASHATRQRAVGKILPASLALQVSVWSV